MRYNIYLLSYNNYYNRQVKKLDTIQDYVDGGYVINVVNDVNFEMADGIASKLIVNYQYVTKEPDYVLIAEKPTTTNPNPKFTRWFIIDSDLTRGSQYEFAVKRDICVDYNDLLLNSTYFIERGYVPDSNDLVFNNEHQAFSQIKQGQTPLYDETGVPWIVGYMARNAAGSTSSVEISTRAYTGDYADIVVNDITQWDYYQYCNINPNHTTAIGDDVQVPYIALLKLPVQTTDGWGNKSYQMVYLNLDCQNKMATNSQIPSNQTLYPGVTNPSIGYATRDITQSSYNSYIASYGWYNETTVGYTSYLTPLYNSVIQQCLNQMSNNGLAYAQMMQAFKALYNPDNETVRYIEGTLANKTIKDLATGKVYRIALDDRVISMTPTESRISTNSPMLRTRIKFLLNLNASNNWGTTSHSETTGTDPEYQIDINLYMRVVNILLTEVGNVSTWLPGDDDGATVHRQHTSDASFDMFAIPYGNLTVKYGNDTYDCTKELALSMACAFSEKLGSKLYDLQIVPYCPVRQYIKDNGTSYDFDITGEDLSANSGVKKVRKIIFTSAGSSEGGNDIPVGFVFYCSISTQDRIPLQDKNKQAYTIEVSNYKESYNVDMYRLSSPNFASSFEFSPAQNGGVPKFLTSFTYKPFTPYIRIWPEWGRMNGSNANNQDGRGLILQGDFSVPAMLNQWQEYEIQNKNYLNSFNREIVSMKVQQGVEYEEALWKAGFGQLGGAVAGGVAGGTVGGPWGAVAGAGVGLIASGLAAERDIKNIRKLHNDALDKAKTLFNYNLDNIKALPNTIRNIGCLTNDNLLVPVIEYYTASEEEKEAFRLKMQYYGMSVNKVGKIYDYVNPTGETFIQATLLRLLPANNETEADNHLAEELSDEVQKGLYIGGNS